MRILKLIWQYKADILAVISLVSIFLELTPIKFNPISSFLKWLGNKINADILKDITDIQRQLQEQSKEIDQNERDRIRYEILNFAASCRNKDEHTKEEFDHIIEQYDKYEVLQAKLEQPNGKITQAMKFINSLYITRYEKNDFLL